MRTASPLGTTSRRAALPLLIGICGVATCTPEAGGGATGAGGAASGGGGDGGAGTAASGGGDGLPACGDATLVRACASSASLEGDDVFQVTVDGTLTRAEMADAVDTCFASPDMGIGPLAPPVTPVLALRVLSEGVAWDVAMVLPGASARDWTIGEDVSLVLAKDDHEIDGYLTYIAVERQGDLVVAALEDARDGVAVEGIDVAAVGAEECYDGNDTCGRARFEMEVTIGAETATIPTDASAVVGGLLVTNDHFFEHYEYTCCCNMGSAAYTLGAVAVLAE
jgi:hypothetical protein